MMDMLNNDAKLKMNARLIKVIKLMLINHNTAQKNIEDQ